MSDFEPKIIAFLCNWCSYEGAEKAGNAHLESPANILPIKVMCSGRVDPDFVIDAFKSGADGVLVLGCHPGECHYKQGNHMALRRYTLLQKMLVQFGIEQERVSLDWVSATEGDRFTAIIHDMVERIKKIGPMSQKSKEQRRVRL